MLFMLIRNAISNFISRCVKLLHKYKIASESNHHATSFFDTRNDEALRMVANIILYPYKYCLRTDNRARISAIAPDDQALKQFIQTLQHAQEQFSKNPPITNSRAIWSNRDKFCKILTLKTSISISHTRIEEIGTNGDRPRFL
ncbi:MAG: hypothetical protein H7Z39_15425 [Burkholderiaceae bacterium]|nr:hypothetical protein [Burkholderiaceae bacterium]